LQNARFAASVLVRGVKHGRTEDQRLLIRSDAAFPTLYQIRRQGRFTTPVAYATAHAAALFVKNLPVRLQGVFAPEMLPMEIRRAIVAGVRKQGVKITHKVSVLGPAEEEEEAL
jgi:hypothetical protein